MKIRLARAELFHADGRTYMTKLIVTFRNLANSPKQDEGLRNRPTQDTDQWWAFVKTVMDLGVP